MNRTYLERGVLTQNLKWSNSTAKTLPSWHSAKFRLGMALFDIDSGQNLFCFIYSNFKIEKKNYST